MKKFVDIEALGQYYWQCQTEVQREKLVKAYMLFCTPELMFLIHNHNGDYYKIRYNNSMVPLKVVKAFVYCLS